MSKKQKSEMIIAMQLIGMERFEESVNDNIMKDKELLLAMNSVEDVLGHFQWKKSKLMTEAIDRFVLPRLENFDNLDNINASFLEWKKKWLEYHNYLSEKDPDRMLELEEQYDESGENSELEEMTLPKEFEWTPVDYTAEQWQDIADLKQQSQGN
ncbi:MAG: hypothetical protein LBC75_06300 [Fibromonadaceae bacterium]|jgi:hypothetical protein|nr:hypothetical protein [Fibromonadaceae bacterium]